jgi:hypothetical protein
MPQAVLQSGNPVPDDELFAASEPVTPVDPDAVVSGAGAHLVWRVWCEVDGADAVNVGASDDRVAPARRRPE